MKLIYKIQKQSDCDQRTRVECDFIFLIMKQLQQKVKISHSTRSTDSIQNKIKFSVRLKTEEQTLTFNLDYFDYTATFIHPLLKLWTLMFDYSYK